MFTCSRGLNSRIKLLHIINIDTPFSVPAKQWVLYIFPSRHHAINRIFDHPYFSVTDDTGHYQIDNIPPGTYEVIAWQEKFKDKKTKEWKTLSASVTIGDGDTTQNFTFVKEAKK